MKTLILAAFIIITGLASCTVTEPAERVYYPDQGGYSTTYEPYYNPVYSNTYNTRRMYDYRTGRYYYVPVYTTPVYSAPVYTAPVYPNNNYKRDYYRRDNDRRDNDRKDYNRQHENQQQPQANQQTETRLPDGTRILQNGTVIQSNGQVKHRQ